MGYNTENRETLIIIEIPESREKEKEVIARTWEKEKEKTKKLLKITRVKKTEPSIQ